MWESPFLETNYVKRVVCVLAWRGILAGNAVVEPIRQLLYDKNQRPEPHFKHHGKYFLCASLQKAVIRDIFASVFAIQTLCFVSFCLRRQIAQREGKNRPHAPTCGLTSDVLCKVPCRADVRTIIVLAPIKLICLSSHEPFRRFREACLVINRYIARRTLWHFAIHSSDAAFLTVYRKHLILYVLSTMGVSKESISKFLIGNRFHVKLHILSPFGIVTKDFVKPTAEGRQFINGILTTRKRHSSQSCLEKLLDWGASTKEKMLTSAA